MKTSFPWGSYNLEEGEYLGIIQCSLDQLRWGLKNKTMIDSPRMTADIKGYERILKLNDQGVAQEFIETKHRFPRTANNPGPNNMEVIDILKSLGLWRTAAGIPNETD